MKKEVITALLAMAVLMVLLTGCQKGLISDDKLEGVGQDIESVEDIGALAEEPENEADVGEGAESIESALGEEDTGVSDDELDDLLSDIEGSDISDEFDLDSSMDFDLSFT